jgi:autotransporter-associated beta strand protein
MAATAMAGNQYFSGASGTVWDAATTDWGAASGGPYTGTWTSGNTAVFEGTGTAVTVGTGGNPTVGGITFATSAYVLTNGTITLTGTPVIANGVNNATIYSVLAGPGIGFTKTGSGSLTLTGTNTYTGGTTISAGNADARVETALGTGTVTLGDANTGSSSCTLNFGGGGYVNRNFPAPIVVSSSGSGKVTIQAGSGTAIFTNTITLNRDVTLSSPNYEATFSGVISGTGNLTLNSASWAVSHFKATNTFSGNVTISSGTADVQAVAALGTNTVTLGDANTGSSACTLQVNGSFAPSIAVSTNGSGTLTIKATGSGANFTNTITLNRDVTVNSPGANASFNKAISGTGNITVTGNWTTKFIANNTFHGNVTITNGATLQLGAFGGPNDALPDSGIVTNNGTLAMSGYNETIGGLTGAGTVNVNSLNNTLTVGGGNVTGCNFSGVITDSGNTGGVKISLTKIGTGTQSFSGSVTNTGATTINGGALLVVSPGVMAGTNTVTVNASATLAGNGIIGNQVVANAGSIVSPGTNGGIGTFSLTNAGATALTLNSAKVACKLSADGSLTADKVAVTGTLVLNGANLISLSTPFGTAPAGTYTLMTFAGTSGSGSLALDQPYPNAVLNVNATSVTLTVSGSGTSSVLFWQGDGVANNWDISTANWLAAGVTTTYADGWAVIFNDTGSTNPAVNIGSTVSPGSVTANLTNKNYIIGGADISGASDTLTKNGPGTLTLTSANTYGGATTINGGTLVIGGAGQLGGGNYTGGITDNGTLNYGSFAAQTLGGVISGAGNLLQSGAGGTLTLSQANTYRGGTTICAGTLYANNASAVGTNTVTLGDANTGANDAGFLWNGVSGNVGIPIVVSASGSGLVTIGAINAGTGITLANKITVNREATLQAPSSYSLDFGTGSGLLGSGNVTVTGGTIKLRAGSPGYTGNVIIASGGTVQVGAWQGAFTDFIPDGSSVTVNSGGMLNLSCNGETIGGLNGDGTVSAVAQSGILTVGGGNASGNFSGTIQDNGVLTVGLTKTGTGTQTLSSYNSFSGAAIANGGTLLVNGSGVINSSSVTVTNAVLGGDGTIYSPTAIQTKGTIQPGLGGLDTSTLTINNNLTLNGNAVFILNRTNAPNAASVAGIINLTYGGALTVTNVGPALQLNDTFTLFSAAGTSGTFAATNLPALGGGLAWNWNPTTSVLSVVAGGPSGPATITNSISGGNLTLTWPAGQGWRLVSQTNNLSAGLGTIWSTVSGVSDGSATITVDPAKPTVFYRLVYP